MGLTSASPTSSDCEFCTTAEVSHAMTECGWLNTSCGHIARIHFYMFERTHTPTHTLTHTRTHNQSLLMEGMVRGATLLRTHASQISTHEARHLQASTSYCGYLPHHYHYHNRHHHYHHHYVSPPLLQLPPTPASTLNTPALFLFSLCDTLQARASKMKAQFHTPGMSSQSS
jgi:hypothetical protein